MVNHVFITGASGTIGSAIVPRLLRDRDVRVTLLLRAPDEAGLQQRLDALVAHWGWSPGDAWASRLQALRGDIALPRFGLSEQEWHGLAGRTGRIIHCAASVKLNMPMAQAVATAVTPTATVLDLGALARRAGVLQKMEIVSTVGVWGRAPGHMPERPLPEVQQFHNTYEAAKAEAERLVWRDGGDLPITVHRPSMVVGACDTGQVMHFQVFYHLCEFLSGARTLGVMPVLGNTRLDTVPVDWVADVIAWSSSQRASAGQILHLCSGPDEAIRLLELQDIVRRRWTSAGRALPTLRTVPLRWLERLVPLFGLVAGAQGRRALRGLSPVLEYLAEDQGFANPQTRTRLQSAGLALPPRDRYLGPVLDFYLHHRRTGARP